MMTHPDDGWQNNPVLRQHIQSRWAPRDWEQERRDLELLQMFQTERRRRVREHQHSPTPPPPQAAR